MLQSLKEFPQEKEKRILINGEGAEALLVAYYLSKHSQLLSEIPNLNIYLVHKKQRLQPIEDVERSVTRLSSMSFGLKYATHRLS